MLTDRVVGAVGDPVVAALLLGKSAEAAERGISLTVTGELPASFAVGSPRDLVTVLGNLVDNAIDAVAGTPIAASSYSLEGSPRPRAARRRRQRTRVSRPRRPPTPSSAAGPRRPMPGTRTVWGWRSSRRSPGASAAG